MMVKCKKWFGCNFLGCMHRLEHEWIDSCGDSSHKCGGACEPANNDAICPSCQEKDKRIAELETDKEMLTRERNETLTALSNMAMKYAGEKVNLVDALSAFALSDEYYEMLEVDKKPDDYSVYGHRAIDYRRAREVLSEAGGKCSNKK